jgi:hypothetical protein
MAYLLPIPATGLDRILGAKCERLLLVGEDSAHLRHVSSSPLSLSLSVEFELEANHPDPANS